MPRKSIQRWKVIGEREIGTEETLLMICPDGGACRRSNDASRRPAAAAMPGEGRAPHHHGEMFRPVRTGGA
jgi:hypothetical protein